MFLHVLRQDMGFDKGFHNVNLSVRINIWQAKLQTAWCDLTETICISIIISLTYAVMNIYLYVCLPISLFLSINLSFCLSVHVCMNGWKDRWMNGYRELVVMYVSEGNRLLSASAYPQITLSRMPSILSWRASAWRAGAAPAGGAQPVPKGSRDVLLRGCRSQLLIKYCK